MPRGRRPPMMITCSHFETVAEDVLAVYKQVTGEHLDLNVDRDGEEEEEE